MLTFALDRAPRSSKNRRRIVRAGGRVRSLLSREAAADAVEIALRAQQALAAAGREPWGPDAALSLEVEHDVATDRVRVTVRQVGTLPARGRRGTRQDSFAAIETIADALQGVLFVDDRQVDRGSWRRVRTMASGRDHAR